MANIVVFSGAGMSAESGIGTFRNSGGLWENYRIEEVATPEAWVKNPQKVHEFYNLRRKEIIATSPNHAHTKVVELERYCDVQVITQNIDDLHERSGSSCVIHLHGEIRYAKSTGPNQEQAYYRIEGDSLDLDDKCPEGYPLRPHVVWFGENVPNYDKAQQIIEQADILIVIGTSLQVYPAAGLIYYASRATLKIVIDPDERLDVSKDFVQIKAAATTGMDRCLELVKEHLKQ